MCEKIKKIKKSVRELLKKVTQPSKRLVLLILGSILLLLVIFLTVISFKETPTKTEINTPVIARTELNKKPQIAIQVFEPKENNVIKKKQIEETFDVIEPKINVQSTSENQEESEEKKSTFSAELEIKKLNEKIDSLGNLQNISQEIANLNHRLSKLEGLNDNVGRMANIFLAQQLVLLDNAFKVGGNHNTAIKYVYTFAKKAAKKEKIAARLKELLQITEKQAIITPQALIFYANKLEGIKLADLSSQKQENVEGFFAKIKSLLKSFISVRKNEEIAENQKFWNDNIKALQESIIFSDLITAAQILENGKMMSLGGEDFANFEKLFSSYLSQQLALQAVLGAFIEGYTYDY